MRDRLKIAVAVPGRWTAFELVAALKARGHHITLLTNYPRWVARKFGVDPSSSRHAWTNFLFGHSAYQLHRMFGVPVPEAAIARHFSRWVSRQFRRLDLDVAVLYSLFASDTLRVIGDSRTLTIVNCENSHLSAYARILEEEERRTGMALARPSAWAVKRAAEEYELADVIRVIAQFSRQTFIDEGVAVDKVWCNTAGAPIESFRPAADVIEQRKARIRSGAPLRVIFVGAKILRKGLWDVRDIIRDAPSDRFQFRLVGPEVRETAQVLRGLGPNVERIEKLPQSSLPAQYAWADVYMLPSLEEGFPQTTAQAWASGLPILTTPNGGGADLVAHGITGWILPIRAPDAFLRQLRWCDGHRAELEAMVTRTYSHFKVRTWDDVAADFEAYTAEAVERKRELLERQRARIGPTVH